MSKIHADSAPTPVGAYPHARKVGDLIFLSGIGPRDPETNDVPGNVQDPEGNVVDYDIELQTESVINNLKIILQAAGSSFDRIVDVQVFLTNMKHDFKKFNQIYNEAFIDVGATRTTIEVGALPTPIAIEFKVIAKA